MEINKFIRGDRVSVMFYGKRYGATVAEDQVSDSIVRVCFDGEKRVRWFHAESIMEAMEIG